MKIKLRADSIEVEGYVNAVERNSKPLWSKVGRFIERIRAGAFNRALKRNNNVEIRLNHDPNRVLGSTREGNLELHEDNIGLHARATITDPEVIEKARAGKLTGWSFGFMDRAVERSMEKGMLMREVEDLDLREVSILDDRKRPAYSGTLINARSEEDIEYIHYRDEDFVDNVEVEEEKPEEPATENEEEASERSEDAGESKESVEQPTSQESTENPVDKPVENPVEKPDKIDYSKYRNMINEMRKEN